ncbi:unnamed protein product [Ectocarpus sp. 4 AP-2014]
MCGARVLSGVFHKWAARRATGDFWRLRVRPCCAEQPKTEWFSARGSVDNGGGHEQHL